MLNEYTWRHFLYINLFAKNISGFNFLRAVIINTLFKKDKNGYILVNLV